MTAGSWLLIDGYNLLHASGVFGSGGRTSLESSRTALLQWLAGVLDERQRRRTTIVFDARYAPPGLPRLIQEQGICVRFAPRGREADEVIEQLIQDHAAPRSLVVVSSDHRLHRAARRRRALAIDSERWVARLRQNLHSSPRGDKLEGDSDEGPPDDDLQLWLNEFSADE